MVTLPLRKFFFFPIFLFRSAWEKGVIKAQAQNVARNLADTPANRMTPTIFAQVSFMPTYSYIGVSFNTVLQVLQVCYVYMPYFLSHNVLLPMMPPPPFLERNCSVFFFFFFFRFFGLSCGSAVPSFCL
jgi:hypothetical protein